MINATINVVKIGGNVIDNPEELNAFLDDFVRLAGPKVLVHGGGKEATRLSQSMGIVPQMVDGRRITDAETLDIVTMVYAGLINKRIVAALEARGADAVGLTGADGDAIRAMRRKPEPIDFGFVGDIDPSDINDRFIISLLDNDIIPVFCAITHDGNGQLLNSNADSVATAIATGLTRQTNVNLTFCFEKEGVLTDVNDPKSVLRFICADDFPELKDAGIISDGMLPKIENALKAVACGVEAVTIKSSKALLEASGTVISQ